ncbi:FUSC family protein [Acrocarpospora catenulata]|uniref:FUSC family protein n=1 Tax=Acrocarpospora catenulata TaxID=2836182 RepID=UPI001BDA7605|nr:FUSC family protein [Acrocarpospora catenulata]
MAGVGDRRLAMGYGLVAALGVTIPLVAGVGFGHPVLGGIVALGAWLVAVRANIDPPGVRVEYMLVGVLSLAFGTVLGMLVVEREWVLVLVAPVVAAGSILVPLVGPTAALALLITAANPLPVDLWGHLGLTLIGGLVAAVLVTLSWPWRRSRPLGTILSEAAEEVALLLSATTSADWEAQRVHAASAVYLARTACARRRWRGRSRESEQVATALRKIFYEAVTLRDLFQATEGKVTSERVGLGELAGSLAAAVRSVFGTVEDLPQDWGIGAFTARIEELRGERLADERDLLLVVLLRQIGHTAERIREDVEEARPAARAVRLGGLSLPRLDGSGWRSRLTLDDPGFRHSLRLALGTAVACLGIVVFQPLHAQWLAVTVLLTIQPTYGETFAKVWARVGGSVAGALVAALVLLVAPGYWVLAAIIAVCAALGFGLVVVHYAYWATFMTLCVLLLIDFQTPLSPGIAALRVGLTVAGGVIALVCTRLLWPRGEAVRLRERVARLLESHAAAARTVAGVSRGERSEEKATDRISQAARDADAVSVALAYIPHEPGALLPEHLEGVLDTATRVRDDLITLTTVLREHSGDVGPAPKVLDAVADRLSAGAEAIRTGEPYQSGGDVDTRLADLTRYLGKLATTRLTEITTTPTQTQTKTRKALLHATATNHALRQLNTASSHLVQQATTAP